MSKTKKTICPSPAYKPYAPSKQMLAAMERSRQWQPPLIGLSSNVPSYAKEGK